MMRNGKDVPVSCAMGLLLAAFASTASAQAPTGWIQDGSWLFLGPLGNANGCGPGAAMLDNWIAPLDIATVTPEANDPAAIDFGAAASVDWQGIGDEPAWLSLEEQGILGNDVVDFVNITGTLSANSGEVIPNVNAMAVCVTYVTYKGAKPILLVLCDSSDDSIQVWVNNQRVQNVSACRGTAGSCSETAPVILLPGKNAIKVLVWQGTQGWGFRVRLALPDGPAITDADPNFEFGFDGSSAVSPTSGLITRRTAQSLASCVDPGDLLVTLKGDGGAGGPVNLVERVEGLVEIVDVSNGGALTPLAPIVKSPMGMFEDSRNIGSACVDGSAVLNGDGSYSVTGGGADIWVNGDEFQFAYKRVTGDFELTAHVQDRLWAPGTRWGKVGIMARQDTSRRSRYSMVQTHGEDLQDSDRFAGRRSQGGADNFESTVLNPGEHRDWMRLSRAGGVFTGEMSEDGVTWQVLGTQDWGANAPRTVLLGLAVCAHSDGQGGCSTATITFDEIELVGGNDPPDPPGAATRAAISWSLTRDAINAGVSYKLRGNGVASLRGDDGEHLTLGDSQLRVLSGAGAAGIFKVTQDIGAPCVPGETVYNAGDDSYSITGFGVDIWQTGDQFQYAYEQMTGDFSMIAHVKERTWAPGSRWGKVGIMARQDCTDRARYAMMQTHGEDQQDADRFAARPTHGGADNIELTNLPGGAHRDWMRLDRVGNLFVGSFSEDGVAWSPAGSINWGTGAPKTILLGLAVNAHSDTQGGCVPATIVFDHVSITIPSFTVSRSLGNADACPLESGTAKVVLTGQGDSGPNIPVVETVTGNVVVSEVSNLGRFKKIDEPSPLVPVGIFEDARDLGAPCTPGSTVLNGQSYTVTGGGVDIWQNGDQFQYAYRKASGDFNVVVHVEDRVWAPGSRWGKVGIMARENHGERARYAMIQTHGEDQQDADRFAGRRSTGGSDNFEQTTLAGGEHSDWMRLERIGSVFNGYLSLDGIDWQLMGTMDWGGAAPRTVLLGLAVCAHSDTAGGCPQASITFGDIEITGGAGPHDPLTPQGGTITWSGGRAILQGAGLSYRITGNGLARLTGTAADLPIGGPNTTLLTAIKTTGIGEFSAAHDIGGPCTPGDTAFNTADGSYTVTGGGIDVWQGGDQFQYAYKRITGDFSMLAHVSDRQWAIGSRWGKVGIMARQDCSDRSRYAMIQTHGEDQEDADRFAGRPSHGGMDNFELTTLAGGEHRDWLRLDRVGNVFTGYLSLDGRTWDEMGNMDWRDGASAEALLGLAVCAHSDRQSGCSPTTILFDQVTISGVFVPPPEGTPFHRGDADNNGQLQLTDAVRILNVLFLGTGQIPCADAADADDNGQLQLTDAVRILGVLFLGTGEIALPGPPTAACGSDPTPNDAGTDLGCELYTSCGG